MTPVKYAIVAEGIFLAGKNLGTKLDANAVRGLDMWINDDHILYVTWNKETAKVKYGLHHWVEGDSRWKNMPAETPKADPVVVKAKIKAQVSGPQSHVFDGPGAGKTGNNAR